MSINSAYYTHLKLIQTDILSFRQVLPAIAEILITQPVKIVTIFIAIYVLQTKQPAPPAIFDCNRKRNQ